MNMVDMAAAHAHAHGNHSVQHYPPSPPPSPPSARQRHKKKPDPFEQLAATPISSAPSSPADEPDNDNTEPLLTQIILTPVLFTSFLLSLFLVNYRNRARRAEAHAPASSLLAYLVPSRWLDPEPYQDPRDSTWGRRDAAPHAEPHDAISPRPPDEQSRDKQHNKKRKSWHLNRKIRKMAKLEVGDALEMRGRVIAAMAAVMILACAACYMGLKWFFVSMSHVLSGSQA